MSKCQFFPLGYARARQPMAGFKCVEALGRIIIRGAPTHPQML